MNALRPTTLLFALLFSFPALTQDIRTTLPNGKKVVLHADKTWEYDEGITNDFTKLRDNEIPSFLRAGISADRATLVTAVEMHLQGWRYTMPVPKSAQAVWGNGDGRTTCGMAGGITRRATSTRRTPEKAANGYYYGDEQDNHGT